jgi:hypothetical protein
MQYSLASYLYSLRVLVPIPAVPNHAFFGAHDFAAKCIFYTEKTVSFLAVIATALAKGTEKGDTVVSLC